MVIEKRRVAVPQESGKITVQLEGLGETQLRFDAKNSRVHGLTKWYRLKEVRPGTIIGVESLEPLNLYRFSTLRPYLDTSKEMKLVKAIRAAKVRPRQPLSESSVVVGEGWGKYEVIGRLLEKKLEVYTPVADVGGVDALIRLPNGGCKDVQVKD